MPSSAQLNTGDYEISTEQRRLVEDIRALLFTFGVYEAVTEDGRKYVFGFDEEGTGFYGWRASSSETQQAFQRFGDTEDDAALEIALFLTREASHD